MSDVTTEAQGTPETAPAAPPVDVPTFPEGTKLREYETIYALKPDLADDAVEKFKERIRALIHRDGGKVIKFAIWGKKKTQFEVQKQTRAIYTHVHYLGPSALVAEVERNLRNDENLIRYQTVKIAEETDASKPVEPDTKLAGDADQPERPPREERERRDDYSDMGDRDDRDDRDEGEPESA